MHFNPSLSCNRWIALFDLLGTRDLLAKGEEIRVFLAYDQAVDELKGRGKWNGSVKHAWCSDTFLILATDDSGQSFGWLELLSRQFMYFLIQARIPLRGAIANPIEQSAEEFAFANEPAFSACINAP